MSWRSHIIRPTESMMRECERASSKKKIDKSVKIVHQTKDVKHKEAS
jgi:hypothetical protein